MESGASSEQDLVARVSALIDSARDSVASYVNATLTVTYWQIGLVIDSKVLREGRGEYGAQIVVTLSHKLSWSHFLALLPLRSDDARAFYAREAATGRWTVRELRDAIRRKAWERREIAGSQLGPGSMVPADIFSDPYLLDFLGLHDSYLEADLEAAILRDLEAFLLEVGAGFTFVERQKRAARATKTPLNRRQLTPRGYQVYALPPLTGQCLCAHRFCFAPRQVEAFRRLGGASTSIHWGSLNISDMLRDIVPRCPAIFVDCPPVSRIHLVLTED